MLAAALATAPPPSGSAAPAPRPVPPDLHHLALDPARSDVRFVLSTTWGYVQGNLKELSGEVVSASGDPFTDGAVTIEMRAGSLTTDDDRRDRGLKAQQLAAGDHPVIRFVSTGHPEISSIARNPNGVARTASLLLAGDLTIRGVTRPVSLTLNARREAEGFVVSGETVVRMSEHGIPDPSVFYDKVQDTVAVGFDLFLRAGAR